MGRRLRHRLRHLGHYVLHFSQSAAGLAGVPIHLGYPVPDPGAVGRTRAGPGAGVHCDDCGRSVASARPGARETRADRRGPLERHHAGSGSHRHLVRHGLRAHHARRPAASVQLVGICHGARPRQSELLQRGTSDLWPAAQRPPISSFPKAREFRSQTVCSAWGW